MRILFIYIFLIVSTPFLWACDGNSINPVLKSEIKSNLKPEKEKFFHSTVKSVVDGDTVILNNNMQVRLVGLQAPKIALGRKNYKEWPLGYEAKAALENIALGKNVTLYYGGRRMDRHGRLLAHLFINDDIWVQGEMLKQGMARAYTFDDNRSLVPELYALEKSARDQNIGIWQLDFYRIKDQLESGDHIDSFQIISGKVLNVAQVRNMTFLNFGQDYKTDFTIVVPAQVKKLFEKENINLSSFEGKNIQVRGWLKYFNGPTIDLSHPEQIVIE